MFSIRKIENACIVSHNNADGKWTEKAFLLEDELWDDDAKAYISANKALAADQAETNAFNQIEQIATDN